MKHSLLILSSLTLILSVISCVNEDYDLEKVKLDEVSVLEGIVLPIGSTQIISISDFLTLDQEEDGFIKTDEAGNFYVSMSDSELLNHTFKFDSFSFDGFVDSKKEFGAGTTVTIPPFNLGREFQAEVPLNNIGYDITVTQGNLPEIVTSIRYVDVESEIIVELQYDKSQLPFNQIYVTKGAVIELPDWIVLGEVSSEYEKLNDHQVRFAQDMTISPDGSSVRLPIIRLDLTKLDENQGVIVDGRLTLNAHVVLNNAKLLLKSSDCTSSGEFSPKVSTRLELKPLTVKAICLSGLNLSEVSDISQEINFSGLLPEMLYGDNVVCDFSDLRLKIWMTNGLPFSGKVSTVIDSYNNGIDSPLKQYNLDFDFATSQSVEHLYTESGENSIKVEGFNSILNPVPDYLRINTSVSIDPSGNGEEYGILVPGQEYNVQCGYEFVAPLSFGEDFRIDLSQDIDGFALEVTEVDVAEAHLNMTLINALPLDLSLTAVAIDADGNELEHINVELVGNIKGGTVQSPAVNPITLKLTNSGELKFDGVRISMSATASSDKAELNKDQFIQLTDISIALPKGIKYTFEE